MKEIIFAEQKYPKEKSVYTKRDTTQKPSYDKGGHKESSIHNQPNHLKHWKKQK